MAKLGKSVKGKSKKAKKAKMSSADEKLLDKAKAMELQDYQRALAQKARAAMKEQLEKEREMTRVNAKKVRNGWLKIMRLSKLDSLRRDVEVISQNHERDVDRRDALLQMLDRDVDEAEEQYQMALRDHLRNVDQLILLQDSRLTDLESAFQAEVESLDEEYTEEMQAIREQHAAEKKELMDLIESVERQEEYNAAEVKQEFEQTREEVRNRSIEEVNVLSAMLDNHIEELERHFESAHMNYLQNTDKRTEEFKKYTRDDIESSEKIERSIRKIERLQSSIAHWKVKIAQNSRDFTEKNEQLAAEKAATAEHVLKLKNQMASYRRAQTRRLRDLSVTAKECKDIVKKRLEVAERLLKLAEVARSKESMREKVQPFYEGETTADSAPAEKGLVPFVRMDPAGEEHTGEEEAGATVTTTAGGGTRVAIGPEGEKALKAARASEEAKLSDEELADIALLRREGVLKIGHDMVKDGTLDMLDRFYKRYNAAMLSKLAMERQRDTLKDENNQLRSILAQFLEGVSVTADVMKGPNPLLVINGRANTLPPAVRAAAPPSAVVEANHMVETSRVKT